MTSSSSSDLYDRTPINNLEDMFIDFLSFLIQDLIFLTIRAALFYYSERYTFKLLQEPLIVSKFLID